MRAWWRRADGAPPFVEAKAALESRDPSADLAASASPELAISATLHAWLIARFDRLGPVAREVAQTGAVLDGGFGDDLIARVAQRPGPEILLIKGEAGRAGDYSAPEIEPIYSRARELCKKLGDRARLVHALRACGRSTTWPPIGWPLFGSPTASMRPRKASRIALPRPCATTLLVDLGSGLVAQGRGITRRLNAPMLT